MPNLEKNNWLVIWKIKKLYYACFYYVNHTKNLLISWYAKNHLIREKLILL